MTNNVYIIGSMIRAHPPQVIVQKLLMNESYTFLSRVPFSEIDSNTHDKDNGAGKSMLSCVKSVVNHSTYKRNVYKLMPLSVGEYGI